MGLPLIGEMGPQVRAPFLLGFVPAIKLLVLSYYLELLPPSLKENPASHLYTVISHSFLLPSVFLSGPPSQVRPFLGHEQPPRCESASQRFLLGLVHLAAAELAGGGSLVQPKKHVKSKHVWGKHYELCMVSGWEL